MLTRAVSAPAKYGSPGILRYGGCSFDNETNSPVSVSFAPLPVPDPDAGSRRHKYKMGVQGRTGILNKQRQHTNGINYRPPPGGGMILSSTAAAAVKQKTNNASDPHTDTSISGKGGSSSSSSKESSSLTMSRGDWSLRRTASEDGTANTLSVAHNGGTGFKFWRKTFHAASKRPGLSTVPSEDTMLVTSGTTNNDTTEPTVDLEGRDDVAKLVKTIPVNKDILDDNIQDKLLDVQYPDIRGGPSCPEEPEDAESKPPELAEEKLWTSTPS